MDPSTQSGRSPSEYEEREWDRARAAREEQRASAGTGAPPAGPSSSTPDEGAPPGRPPESGIAAARGFSGGDAGLMAHFYRGEMNRLTVWRNRMDVTSNWAILVTIGLLSLSLQHPSADSLLVVNVATLWVLLIIEARRYRFYDVWRWRIRILEAHVLAPIVSGTDRLPPGPWRHDLTADLLYPTFKMSMAEAMGRRLLRNFFFLFVLVLAVSLGNVFQLTPATSSWHLITRDQVVLALGEHWLFLLLLALAYVPLIVLGVRGWRRRRVAVELHDPAGRQPYRI